MILPLLFLLAQSAAETPPDPAQLEAVRAAQAQAEAEAEASREAAAEEAEAAEDIQRSLIAIADDIAATERRALELTERLSRLNVEEAALSAALSEDRESMQRVLAALQRAEMRKPPPIAVSPDDAANAARSAMLLSAIAPQLEARAQEISERIGALTQLRADIERDQTALAQQEIQLADNREASAALLQERQKRRQNLTQEAGDAETRAATLAQQAESLEALIAEIEARRAEEEARAEAANEPLRPFDPPASFGDARGQLRPPAEGALVTAFGASDGVVQAVGQTLSVRAKAQVVSPFDARVEFSGPLQGYGGLLILNVGGGYHIVLSGLSRLYVEQGQTLLAGEPVGEMPDRATPAPDLYYEIRKDGAPLDPAEWTR